MEELIVFYIRSRRWKQKVRAMNQNKGKNVFDNDTCKYGETSTIITSFAGGNRRRD